MQKYFNPLTNGPDKISNVKLQVQQLVLIMAVDLWFLYATISMRWTIVPSLIPPICYTVLALTSNVWRNDGVKYERGCNFEIKANWKCLQYYTNHFCVVSTKTGERFARGMPDTIQLLSPQKIGGIKCLQYTRLCIMPSSPVLIHQKRDRALWDEGRS